MKTRSVCALGVVAAGSGAQAQLWNTGAWDGRDGRSSDRASLNARPETRAADDVVLATGNGLPYTISGLSGRALALRYQGVFAEIFADASGVPAATPSYTLAPMNVQVVQTGVFGQYDLLNATFDTSGLNLAPGRWWVSVVCNVSGQPPPNDGYGFFATGGNGVVQGSQGYYRVGTAAWAPITNVFGYASDFSFTLLGVQQSATCYPNCDNSTTPPILNIGDYVCFLNRFTAGSSYANCDGSTTPPVLNVGDFTCFLNRFTAGCT
jgi:hypothetical protein